MKAQYKEAYRVARLTKSMYADEAQAVAFVAALKWGFDLATFRKAYRSL